MSLAVPDAAHRRPRSQPAGGGCAAALVHLLNWQRRLAKRKPKYLLFTRRFFSSRKLLPPPAPASPAPSQPPQQLPAPMPKTRAPGIVVRLMGLESMPPASGKKAGKKSHGRDIDLPMGSPRSSYRGVRIVQAAASRIFDHGPDAHRALPPCEIADASSDFGQLGSMESAETASLVPSELNGVCRDDDPVETVNAGFGDDGRSDEIRMERLNATSLLEFKDPGFHREASERLRIVEVSLKSEEARDHCSLESTSSDSLQFRLNAMKSKSEAKASQKVVSLSDNLDQCIDKDCKLAAHVSCLDHLGGGVDPDLSRREFRRLSRDNVFEEKSAENELIDRLALKGCKNKDEARLTRHNSVPRQKVCDISFGRRVPNDERSQCTKKNFHDQLGVEMAVKGTQAVQKRRNDVCLPNSSTSASNTSNAKRSVSKGLESSNKTGGSSCTRRDNSKRGINRATARIRKAQKLDNCASTSSAKPVVRPSADYKTPSDADSGGFQDSDTSSSSLQSSFRKSSAIKDACSMDFDRDGFNRLLQEKIKELDPSRMDESAAKDALSGRLTASVLQELISDLVKETPLEQCGYSSSSVSTPSIAVPVFVEQPDSPTTSHLTPAFHDYCQDDDSSSANLASANNQLSPISVLETSFSTDTCSLDSPDDNSGKAFFEAENFTRQESVDSNFTNELSGGILTEIVHAEVSPNLDKVATLDFEFLEGRLDSFGEVLSYMELLFRSNGTAAGSSFHSFLLDTLDAVIDIFVDTEAIFGTAEKEGCQVTNFFFDCIIEHLSAEYHQLSNVQQKPTPLLTAPNALATEICNIIRSWYRAPGSTLDSVLEKELNCTATRWAVDEGEEQSISIDLECDIMEELIGELASDLRPW